MTEAVETPVVAATTKPKFCAKSSEGLTVFFKFGNGDTLSLDLNELSDETKEDLMIHGALQKIGDSYSSAGGDFAFATAAASKTIDNLRKGLFNAARTGSGEGKKSAGELAQALAAIKGLDVATVEASLEAATDEQRKALRSHPAIKLKIAELRAEKARQAAEKAGNLELAF